MYSEQSPYRGNLLARSSTVNFSLWYGRFTMLSMILPMVLLMYLTIYDCCHICFSQELNFPHQLPPINLATNRQLQQNPKLQPRILVVQLAKDQSATYNSVMNSIFRCVQPSANFYARNAAIISRLQFHLLTSSDNINSLLYLFCLFLLLAVHRS